MVEVETELRHLNEKVLQYLDLPAGERIAVLKKDFWVDYPKADFVLGAMESIFNYPKVLRLPHLFITAPSNNGKTHLVTYFSKQHPIIEKPNEDQDLVPVILIETPTSASENHLYDYILKAIGTPTSPKDSLISKKGEAVTQMLKVKTKIVIMDNLQNIQWAKNDQIGRFIEALRILATCKVNNIEPLGVSLVLTGTPGAYDYLGRDTQLANRFEEIELPKWKHNMDLLKLLANLETMLPLREPSKLTQKTIAEHILYLSEGLIGEIIKILRLACEYAIEHNFEKINLDIIKKIDYVKPSLRRLPYREGDLLEV